MMMCDTVPDAGGKRCRRCGAFFNTTGKVFAHCGQLDLSVEPSKKAKCGGCSRRQEQANRLIPGAGDAMAKLADPIADAVGWKEKSLLLEFTHGLGDGVQFTVVLKHLAALFPEWNIDVCTQVERHDMMRGAGARYCFTPGNARGEHVYHKTINIVEPAECFHDSPATKAESILRYHFGITPRLELSRYHVAFNGKHSSIARQFINTLPNIRGFVLLHYQGDSMRRAKNIDEGIIRACCRHILEAGCTPVIFDYARRSKLIDDQNIFRAEVPADPCVTAALTNEAALCVGIDSGPGHVFGSETLSTPALIVWRGNHPYNYYELAEHVTHVLPQDHWQHLRGQGCERTGLGFFQSHYHYVQCQQHLRYELPELVAAALEGGINEIRGRNRHTVFGHFDESKFFSRVEGPPPDALINCGVGMWPHCEAAQFHDRWPQAAIVGCEPNREIYGVRTREYPGTLLPVAVGEREGSVTLHPGLEDGGMTSVLLPTQEIPIAHGEPYEVTCTTIDHIAPPCHRGWLWLDIEGYEAHALRGATETLRRCNWVSLEVSNRPRREGEATVEEIESILTPYGFRLIATHNDGPSHDRLYAKG